MQCVMQVQRVFLSSAAGGVLTYTQYEQAQAFCEGGPVWHGRIEAVLASSEEEGAEALRESLFKMISYRFSPKEAECFRFDTSYQEIKGGRFWMPSSVVYGGSRPVVVGSPR